MAPCSSHLVCLPSESVLWCACASTLLPQLSEEARLAGGSWQPLIPEEHPGIAEVKWCRWGRGQWQGKRASHFVLPNASQHGMVNTAM